MQEEVNMDIASKNNQLDILKLNLEIFKLKKLIGKKASSQTIEQELNDYLFYLDANEDFQLNNKLDVYNFSKYFILNIIKEFIEDIDEIKHFDSFIGDLNNKIDDIYIKMEFPHIDQQSGIFKKSNSDRISDLKFDDDLMDKIISEIQIENFDYQESNDDLIIELDEFIKIPIFKYSSRDLNDTEISKLINMIKVDISSNRISGEISDVVDFYFDEYKSIKRKMELNHFLREYIRTESFNSIIKYYSDEIVINVINNVKRDISNDKTMDKNKIILKIKDYLQNEKIKIILLKEFEILKGDIPKISKEYNLTIKEVDEIFNQMKVDINNNSVECSLDVYLKSKLAEKIELNKSDSRIKLNNVIKGEKIREEISFEESDLDEVTDEIGELIYYNQIRSHEITEELIIKKLRWVVYGIR